MWGLKRKTQRKTSRERKTQRKTSRAHLAHLRSNGPHAITMIIIRVMFGFKVKL